MADIHLISVPTSKENLYSIVAATTAIEPALRSGDCVALRSTVPPGTTRKVIAPILERVPDLCLCYNPEYLRAENHDPYEDFINQKLIIIGKEQESQKSRLESLYKGISTVYTTFEVAEMAKLAHNNYNAAKISFFNEIWQNAQELGINGNEVNKIVSETAEASWNKNYGIVGGKPYGGSCLPKDIDLAIHFYHREGLHTSMLEATKKINERFSS